MSELRLLASGPLGDYGFLGGLCFYRSGHHNELGGSL